MRTSIVLARFPLFIRGIKIAREDWKSLLVNLETGVLTGSIPSRLVKNFML